VAGRPEALVGRLLAQSFLQQADHWSSVRTAVARAARGAAETAVVESGFVKPNGESVSWEIRVSALHDRDDRPFALLCLRDRTDTKILWDALVRADRLAGLGELAAILAHEFNNLIGGVTGFAQLAQLTGSLEDYRKMPEIIFQTGERAKKLTGGIMGIAGRQPDRLEQAGLLELLDQPLAVLEPRFAKQGVEVDLEIDPDLSVFTDAARLQQVFLHALLFLRAHLVKSSRCAIRTESLAGAVRVVFADAGPSLPLAELEKIYDLPARVTNGGPPRIEPPGPTGFAVCRAILARLGGDLVIHNAPEGGYEIVVTLPTDPTRQPA
jgi:C4-dicarboxylate-specific signal transduction histidine kinase